MDTLETTRLARRKHSKEFRAEVIQACRQPSASVAAIALRSGLNANVVYRWLREDAGVDAAASSLAVMGGRLGRRVHCRAVAPAGGTTVHGHPPRDAPGAFTVTASWPLQGAGECAAWLRDWLR